ncbi:MAG: BolA family transcriptional regulator [Methylophilaceae bacterium]|nr:BolA family transcriptional regulator [Methylophilaceae bacterium]
MQTPLTNIIKSRLAILEPSLLEIEDDSAAHAGHKGNGGGGHFSVKIVSSHFLQKSQIIRHRLIYQTLADLMPQQIHALSILAIAPNEPH